MNKLVHRYVTFNRCWYSTAQLGSKCTQERQWFKARLMFSIFYYNICTNYNQFCGECLLMNRGHKGGQLHQTNELFLGEGIIVSASESLWDHVIFMHWYDWNLCCRALVKKNGSTYCAKSFNYLRMMSWSFLVMNGCQIHILLLQWNYWKNSIMHDQNGLCNLILLSACYGWKSNGLDNFVQIINVSRLDWVCVSNNNLSSHSVDVFDSIGGFF